jgi:ATP phosphoribosyltransferase regulatory subunit
MNEDAERALLPEGLHDELPPDAAREQAVIACLMQACERHGYERVKPPLLEFEESLLAGIGAQVARHMFRLMDPISQRMMAVRTDMTTQVARIAASRLKHVPRPLRLCYAGQVLRVRGSQLRPERQYTQAGAELIGPDSTAADAEMLLMAAAGCAAIGVERLSIDLTAPGLVPLVCQQLGLPGPEAEAARAALDRKDAGGLDGLKPAARRLLSGLLRAAGPAAAALQALAALELPATAGPLIGRLAALAEQARAELPELRLTVDPGESRGFEYETGVSFTLFADGVRGELGRGGRYHLADGEPATGVSLYLDSVMRAVPRPGEPVRLYMPCGEARSEARRLRAEGWSVLAGLAPEADAVAEARRLRCSHVFRDGRPSPLD